MTAGDRQFCTFTLDELYLGVPAREVQEVLPSRDMTRVPLAPPGVRGLINLRGEIVPAIDLRHGLRLRAGEGRPMNVVVRTPDGPVSLLVDEIGDVLKVAEEAFEPPPEPVAAATRGLIRGVFKLRDRLLVILDIDKIVAPEALR